MDDSLLRAIAEGREGAALRAINERTPAQLNALSPCAPLIFAAETGSEKIVRKLINAKADVNAVGDGLGRRPIIMAARFGNAKVFSILVRNGADVDASYVEDGQGKLNALSVAFEHDQREIGRLLFKNPPDTYYLNEWKWMEDCAKKPIAAADPLDLQAVANVVKDLKNTAAMPLLQQLPHAGVTNTSYSIACNADDADFDRLCAVRDEVVTRHLQGRDSDCMPLLQEALSLTRQLVACEQHPLIASSLNSIADCFCSMGKYVEALKHITLCLDMRATVLPPRHIDLAKGYLTKGAVLSRLGRKEKAVPILELARSICEEHDDAVLLALVDEDLRVAQGGAIIPASSRGTHLVTRSKAFQMLRELRDQGKVSAGLVLVEELTAYDVKASGARSVDVGFDLDAWGALLSIAGRHEEANSKLTQALGIFEVDRRSPLDLAMTLNNLGWSVAENAALGDARFTQAHQLYSRASETIRQSMGADVLDHANILRNLAETSAQLGSFEDARQHLKEADRIFVLHGRLDEALKIRKLRIDFQSTPSTMSKMPQASDKCSSPFCTNVGGTLKTCGRCKAAKYCSTECQKADWKKGGHKQQCRLPEERVRCDDVCEEVGVA